MKKARLYFSPLEHEYNRLFGKYPDYDFIDLYRLYGSETAGRVVQEHINVAWDSLKEKEQKRKEALIAECPF